MANEEVLGPRKTMFVLVIVVGCFAVLWPRILSPLILGSSREQLKPNQFDRDAGCCEVLFEKDMAIMELLNEVCSLVTHTEKLSPYSAAECRKAVNETCGVDIAAYLKRSENVGKTSKMLIETMKNSNSSCLREHFGVPIWSLGPHLIQNSWTQQDTLKQERPPIRGAGPHPALRERGRAIPPGVPPAPTRGPVAMPPNVRVRSSPLSVYFELDIKPPPIPGMRPPLGSPGGPVPAPKSSMGFVMPIYTICIIVFFVYTLSKILFKRTGTSPYEPITPDPQFRRRVFRDDSRTSPDKLVVTAISGLVAEVQQQMEASYAQNQQWQDVQQDNHPRPYTNGTILHNSGPVHIVASEYQEVPTEKAAEQKDKDVSQAPETIPEIEESITEIRDNEETISEIKNTDAEIKDIDAEIKDVEAEIKDVEEIATDTFEADINVEKKETTSELAISDEITSNEPIEPTLDTKNVKDSTPEPVVEREFSPEIEKNIKEPTPEPKSATPEIKADEEVEENSEEEIVVEEEEQDVEELEQLIKTPEVIEGTDELINLLANDEKIERNGDIRKTEEFLHEETSAVIEEKKDKQSTPELLEDAIKDEEEHDDNEKSSVKHEAESVQSIFLETEIPQQSRVLVADFAEDCAEKPQPTKHSPMVVSGKMTLSLIQDAPRDTPERDPESTVDEFTTASAVTQNAAEKEEEESEEEIEEEIEIEEIEEEVEEEEEEEPEQKPKKPIKKTE